MSDAEPRARARDCPCEQTDCEHHGLCVECVEIHRKGGHHLPECMQPMLRRAVSELAGKVELRVSEGRPGNED
jgi:hypothetical protein